MCGLCQHSQVISMLMFSYTFGSHLLSFLRNLTPVSQFLSPLGLLPSLRVWLQHWWGLTCRCNSLITPAHLGLLQLLNSSSLHPLSLITTTFFLLASSHCGLTMYCPLGWTMSCECTKLSNKCFLPREVFSLDKETTIVLYNKCIILKCIYLVNKYKTIIVTPLRSIIVQHA